MTMLVVIQVGSSPDIPNQKYFYSNFQPQINMVLFKCGIAGGRHRATPHWPEKYANTSFLVLLRPIFAPLMKIAPPMELAIRSCEGPAVVWTRIVNFFFFLDRT